MFPGNIINNVSPTFPRTMLGRNDVWSNGFFPRTTPILLGPLFRPLGPP
jgi:hypothetical protein